MRLLDSLKPSLDIRKLLLSLHFYFFDRIERPIRKRESAKLIRPLPKLRHTPSRSFQGGRPARSGWEGRDVPRIEAVTQPLAEKAGPHRAVQGSGV